jgi:DNA-directed RNA polymerase subunit RPC12/RpoP
MDSKKIGELGKLWLGKLWWWVLAVLIGLLACWLFGERRGLSATDILVLFLAIPFPIMLIILILVWGPRCPRCGAILASKEISSRRLRTRPAVRVTYLCKRCGRKWAKTYDIPTGLLEGPA